MAYQRSTLITLNVNTDTEIETPCNEKSKNINTETKIDIPCNERSKTLILAQRSRHVARKHASEESTLALKPRADVTRSPN